jgi:hypothetical protein
MNFPWWLSAHLANELTLFDCCENSEQQFSHILDMHCIRSALQLKLDMRYVP